jgi:hypothetical protein
MKRIEDFQWNKSPRFSSTNEKHLLNRMPTLNAISSFSQAPFFLRVGFVLIFCPALAQDYINERLRHS